MLGEGRSDACASDVAMKYALFWSGGKDSLLALDRAERAGLEVTHLATIYEENSGRVRFHGVRINLLEAQASGLGRTLIAEATNPRNFETAFLSVLGRLQREGVGGVCFGNIHLADIRAWYESRTTANGFSHIEPLWGSAPRALIEEFADRGHRARIVSVHLKCGKREWLGREFTRAFITELAAVPGVDICGERGEYHSFAFAGPMFRECVAAHAEGCFEREEHLILDLKVAER
jgi:uncharacterized protein (TIGR00290 family)